MKKILFVVVIMSLLLAGCASEASVASQNLSEGADNFQVQRRVVFYNAITDSYILVVEGRCSIDVDGMDNQLELTCKTGEGIYKKHFLGLSDNTTYFVEQLESVGVDDYRYTVRFRPETVVPNIVIE